MSRFHPLTVKKINRETADAVSVSLSVPAEFKKDFHYIQGQYLTFKLTVNGEELRRSYSICSSPYEADDLVVAVKKVKDGRMSTYFNDKLKEGDVLDTMVPMGNFHSALSASNKKNYVLFAGGSGVTPMMSIIKAVLKQEPNSTVSLFYGNQNESAVIFKKQLDDLAASHSSHLKVYHILSEAPAGHANIYRGIMDKAKNLELIKEHVSLHADNEYFVCGPTPMMDAVKNALEDLKVNSNKVHIEYFSSPVDASAAAESHSGVACKATIILDGDEVVVNMEEGENVLDAAIRAGLDAPYACKGGSCCTCRALLTSGKVEMAVNFALLDNEVKEGYILTCQSTPQTPEITVDYDRGK